MKISYDWLSRYVDHGRSPEQLGEALTMGGLEVDETDAIGQSFEHVVIGRVDEVRSHPNADRLVLCLVDVGGDAPRQIVCGAPNVAAGQRVAVALPGARVRMPDRDQPDTYHPLTVEQREVRGEASEGMICAEDELGLSDDHSGILVLDGDMAVGRGFAEYLRERELPPEDTIYNIDLTPNRADAASHIGVARDAAALTGSELQRPAIAHPERDGDVDGLVDIDIQDAEGCPRYAAMIVRGVSVDESPEWMQYRLRSIGLRPRNNIVDITNFVMHECGQPLHAFDLNQLSGPAIEVRRSQNEQTFTTLDGNERTVPEGTLLICDARRPVAIAGIMGGRQSEVTERTTDVLIESAYFDPQIIRRAVKALHLHTDSSYRFERGVDPNQQVWAAARAADLMAEIAGGTRASGVVDIYPEPISPAKITLRAARVESVLGIELSAGEIADYLTAIGCAVESTTDGQIRCEAPSFRPDLDREVDLIEEVARLYGYNNIPERGRTQIPSSIPRQNRDRSLRDTLRNRLVGQGFREIYTNSMLREQLAETFADRALPPFDAESSVVETLNPISREMAALRPSLLPGMLDVMSHNQHHGVDELRFLEFGHVFRSSDRSDTIVPGYREEQSFIVGVSGPSGRTSWDREVTTSDFFDLKGIVETLLSTVNLDNFDVVSYSEPTAVTAYRLVLTSNGSPIGVVARLLDDVAEEYDLIHPVLFAEFSLDRLADEVPPAWSLRYRPVSRFPRVDRDIAVVTSRSAATGDLIKVIEREGAPLLQDIEVFDVYEGEHVPQNKKSVAFGLTFGADHTLVDEEVDEKVEAIVQSLRDEYDAELRA